jgi:hypothetical protein
MQFIGQLASRRRCGHFFVFAIGAVQTHPDWTISTPIAIVGAVVIWIIGRAARYVLAGQ